MTAPVAERAAPRDAPPRHALLPRWRPSAVTIVAAVLAFGGVGFLLYPVAAAWLSSVEQSQLVRELTETIADSDPPPAEQLRLAHAYNEALSAGVLLEANTNVPTGDGTTSDESLAYETLLVPEPKRPDAPMARIRIPSIGVDLPIYHGTGEETLLRGAGHLEGSHLPVGGAGTHSVVTAHRGLANATMFSDLDRVGVGDTFTLEVFGEVLTYRVRETRVVEPDETDALRAIPGDDIVTLVTCTPLGINSHRILVTGERVIPTPIEDVEAAGETPDVPGFPWWLVGLGAAFVVVGVFVWRSGYSDAAAQARRLSRGAASVSTPPVPTPPV